MLKLKYNHGVKRLKQMLPSSRQNYKLFLFDFTCLFSYSQRFFDNARK